MIRNVLSVVPMMVVAASLSATAAEPNKCLRWVDIKDLTRLNADEVVATTNGGEITYLITFTQHCDYQQFSDHYFVVQTQQRLACVTPQDVFHVHNSGACLIASVAPMPEKPAPSH